MKAAADPDSKVLQAVLARRKQFETPEDRVIEAGELRDTCRPNSTVEWPGQDFINTPLLQAIRSQLLQNVELLLNSGANPDGIDMGSLESYQSLFLRFRPRIPDYVDIDGEVAVRKTLLACMGLSQTAAITVEEIEDRTYYIAPFWTIHTSMAIDTFPGGDDMHSVVAAARLPSTQILNMLLKAGADASIWTLNSNRDHDPVCPMPSSLAVTSPLHAAIEANIPMVPHLLSLGFDPDFVFDSSHEYLSHYSRIPKGPPRSRNAGSIINICSPHEVQPTRLYSPRFPPFPETDAHNTSSLHPSIPSSSCTRVSSSLQAHSLHLSHITGLYRTHRTGS